MSSQRSSLALLFLLCGACNDDPQSVVPDRRGGRGESCLVTNDCKEPLLCFGGRCLDPEPSVAPTANVCIAAECISNGDCCPAPTPSERAQCAELKSECASGSSFACSQHAQTCDCHRTCKDHACSDVPANVFTCRANADCAAGTCVKGECVECTTDAGCGGRGLICESKRCRHGCERDEECPALTACVSGRCAERGCKTDRECVFLLGARDAVCSDGECVRKCGTDADCTTQARRTATGYSYELSTCTDGVCQFLGCAHHAECSALTGGAFPDSGKLSLCVSQKEADAFRKATAGAAP